MIAISLITYEGTIITHSQPMEHTQWHTAEKVNPNVAQKMCELVAEGMIHPQENKKALIFPMKKSPLCPKCPRCR